MKNFLEVVAEYFADNYRSHLHEFCFLFPNKRSRKFFLNHLLHLGGEKPFAAPEVITLSALMEEVSGLVDDSRYDLAMRLYAEYRDLVPPGESVQDFASFLTWGEMALKDFDEADMNDVPVEELFTNVKRHREILSTFMTEEQLQVLEQYFGQARADKDYAADMWRHYAPKYGASEEGIRDKFTFLWMILYELYQRLNRSLEADGLGYTGRIYRNAYERLREEGVAALRHKCYVFVGFNNLSVVELKIFDLFRKWGEDTGIFVWNFTGPAMTSTSNSDMEPIRRYIKDYPIPPDLAERLMEAESRSLPKVMNIYKSPSNSAQAKIVGEVLGERLAAEDGDDGIRDALKHAKVAIVLPDETLLLPMLYSLPEQIEDVNLTMGYPMRYTPALSLARLLKNLQGSKRLNAMSGEIEWFNENVRLLLSHPLMHVWLTSDVCERICREMSQKRRIRISTKDMLELDFQAENGEEIKERLSLLLHPISLETAMKEAYEWMDRVLESVMERLQEETEEAASPLVRVGLELKQIDTFRHHLRMLYEGLQRHKIEVDFHTLTRLTINWAGRDTVSFNGEPVSGLQVLGVLETRCLDFDYLFIPSMGERIFPKKVHRSSLIPAQLRKAYNLPDLDAVEKDYAYHFYSLIARAKEVYFTYDANVSGMKTGDMSRYLLQLIHLYAKENIRLIDRTFTLNTSTPSRIVVEKDEDTMALLEKYRHFHSGPGPHRFDFSASSLSHYLQCPLKFYLEKVKRLREGETPSETLDSITEGNIVHNIMERIYIGNAERKDLEPLEKPVDVSPQEIQNLIANRDYIKGLVKRGIYTEYLKEEANGPLPPLETDLEMMVEPIADEVINILRRDLAAAPLSIIGVEFGGRFPYKLPSGGEANVTFKIDRMDFANVQMDTNLSREKVLRIVDYKTGKPHLRAQDMDDVFSGSYAVGHIFQLLTYAYLYTLHYGKPDTQVFMELYSAPKLAPGVNQDTPYYHYPEIDGKSVRLHSTVLEEFSARFGALIEEILDPATPFTSTDDPSRCTLCRFAPLCGR